MELTVVIPCRNVETTLAAQLDGLLAQSWDGAWEIVVVDNASTDSTAAVGARYERASPRVRVVPAFERAGLSYARNAGIAAAAGAHVALCDGDDIVANGWVAAMGDALRRHPCVTGPIELDRLNPPWLADSRGRRLEREIRTFGGLFPVLAGNNAAFRRSVIESVGGFDEGFGMTSEVELSFRLWRAGFDVTFVPDAAVHYRYRTAPRDLWRQGFSYGRDHPLMCKRVRHAGFPPPSRLASWRSWAWLPCNLHRLASPQGRAVWAWVAGNRSGALAGSVRHRALYL